MKEFFSNNKMAIIVGLSLGVVVGASVLAVKMFTIEPEASE